MRPAVAWTIFVICCVLFGVLFVYPLAVVVRGGFLDDGRLTFRFLAGVFKNPVYAAGLMNSVGIGVGTTLLVTLIALPLASLQNRWTFPGKGLLTPLILAPMILPPFVGAIGFQQILGQYGALNALFHLGPVDWLGRGRYVGVILLQALSLYPIMYLNLSAALANIDPAMEQAALNLGASAFTRFRRITLPLAMPGLFAGGTLVFIFAFTELGTPLMLGYYRCASVQVFDALKEIGASGFPYALVFVMLVSTVTLYAASKFLFGGRGHAMQTKSASAAMLETPSRLRGLMIACLFGGVSFVALLPHLAVVLISLSPPGRWYRAVLPDTLTLANYSEALAHSMTVSSISNSLFYSTLAVVFNCVLGLSIALVVVRSNIKVRGALDVISMLPLAVPGLVMAFGYLAVSQYLSRLPVVKDSTALRSLLDIQTNPTLFLVIAYAMRRLPYMVRAATAGLEQTSATFEEAAANLGSSHCNTLRRITLPLIFANLIAGAMLAFAFSMLEVSDSIMLAQRADEFPITKAIYELSQLIGSGKHIAAALGVWAMLFLGAVMLAASALLGKRLGALFRA